MIFLVGGNLAGVFLIRFSTAWTPIRLPLDRVEESVFVTFYRNNVLAYFQVVFRAFSTSGPKYTTISFPPFSSNLDSIYF